MIKIVTDSIASIPREMLKGRPIEVVTTFIHRHGVEFADTEMDIDEFYSEINDMIDDIPTSSQPSQHTFENLFEKIAQAGDQVLGVFVGSALSGTHEGALRAAMRVKERIQDFTFSIVDTYSCAFDEAWPVLNALEAAESKAGLDDCVEAALQGIKSSRFLFTPESLTFLQKGGRIGNAAALLGNLLHLSPVLTMTQGKAGTVAKVRSRKKALERIISLLIEDIEKYGLKRLVVHYIGDKKPAIEWAESVIEPLLRQKVDIIPVSPVIGLHTGPAIGIAYECDSPMPYKFNGDYRSLVYSSR